MFTKNEYILITGSIFKREPGTKVCLELQADCLKIATVIYLLILLPDETSALVLLLFCLSLLELNLIEVVVFSLASQFCERLSKFAAFSQSHAV